MAYLHAAWNSRFALKGPERIGFAQFFYSFINTHLESRLCSLIDLRLESMRTYVQEASHNLAYYLTHVKPGDASMRFRSLDADSHPAFYSLHKMINEKGDLLTTAPIGRLMRIYDSIFPTPLRTILGDELKLDLDAVISMRNVFAHGRRITIDHEGPMGAGAAQLDSSTLKDAAARLKQTGILPKDETVSVENYHLWERSIFADAALMYFYGKIVEIDDKVKGCPTSRQEADKISKLPKLPELRQAP